MDTHFEVHTKATALRYRELKMLRTMNAIEKRQPHNDASVVNLVASSTTQNGLTLPIFIASSTLVKDHVRGSDSTKT